MTGLPKRLRDHIVDCEASDDQTYPLIHESADLIEALWAVVEAGKNLNDVAAKAVFEDGHEEHLLIENWPLMDALARFREAVGALRSPVALTVAGETHRTTEGK